MSITMEHVNAATRENEYITTLPSVMNKLITDEKDTLNKLNKIRGQLRDIISEIANAPNKTERNNNIIAKYKVQQVEKRCDIKMILYANRCVEYLKACEIIVECGDLRIHCEEINNLCRFLAWYGPDTLDTIIEHNHTIETVIELAHCQVIEMFRRNPLEFKMKPKPYDDYNRCEYYAVDIIPVAYKHNINESYEDWFENINTNYKLQNDVHAVLRLSNTHGIIENMDVIYDKGMAYNNDIGLTIDTNLSNVFWYEETIEL